MGPGYVRLLRSMGTDESIIEDARMSTGKGFQGWDKDLKLLERLWKHQHTSAFEGCSFTVEVKAPMFIIRQWQRHRTQSFNEWSARYSELEDEFYIPTIVRKQDTKNKQGSTQDLQPASQAWFRKAVEGHYSSVYDTYQAAIQAGVCREQARIILPIGVYTKMRATANLLNWLKFLRLRMADDAQEEMREYATCVADIVKQLYPRTWSVYVAAKANQ